MLSLNHREKERVLPLYDDSKLFPNVYNLVTKRAVVDEYGTMEWIDGNIGSKVTMKYPAVFMRGEGARGTVLSIALAGKGQHQDSGAKMMHLVPNCSSTIISKSISEMEEK